MFFSLINTYIVFYLFNIRQHWRKQFINSQYGRSKLKGHCQIQPIIIEYDIHGT
uniref:Uncharacterized protein n=1 Tax=Arion vulgaris TaxID=1028688 RepID=A0A0B7BQX6_9EUPU